LLGPAVLASSKVSEIQLGRSEDGLVLVSIVLNPSGVTRLRSLTNSHPTKFYAVVALGQALSYPTASQLSSIGKSGHFQVAGGLSLADRRPSELAQVLHARSVVVQYRVSPGVQY
jgi:preprotein translocase subunit SecD